jgi:hypothetical protein
MTPATTPRFAEQLAAACDTAATLAEALAGHAGGAGHLLPSVVMAMTAAATARDALITAPSLPPVGRPLPSRPTPPDLPAEHAADLLAAEASTLTGQLTDLAAAASDPRDRDLLTEAAAHIRAAHGYLAGTRL